MLTVPKHSLRVTTLAVTIAAALSIGSGAYAAQPDATPDPDRVWVKFKPGAKGQVQAALKAAGGRFHHEFDDLHAFAVSVPPQALNGLRHNKHIEYIEADPARYPAAQVIPYGITDVQASETVATGADGTGVKVCVIDSGIKSDHEDFAGIAMTGYAPAGQNWYSDDCGHGTHVAGTIAATGNNVGVVGVSPGKVALHIVKYFNGAACGFSYSSTLVDAMQRCQAAGAKVINMSLKSGSGSATEETAINNIYSAGVLLVAAAGNDGNTTKSYPASYANVVSVAAVDSASVKAAFSQYNDAVDIAAPGVDIHSTYPKRTGNTTVNGVSYQSQQIVGTAQTTVSAPLVNGGLCDNVGSWTNKVVLCQRGSNTIADKVSKAKTGGALGVIVHNNAEGNTNKGLGAGVTSTLPGVTVSQADGQTLLGLVGQTATLNTSTAFNLSEYFYMDGTSMATPHVSGVAALLFSAKPSATPGDVRNAMTATALDRGTAGRDNEYGYGLVQSFDAAEALVGGGGPINAAPTANFTSSVNGLTVSFTDASTDSDGSIASRSWSFGDGTTSTATSPSKTYAAAGTYTVTLTVTDNAGASNTKTAAVTVTAPPTGGNVLSNGVARTGISGASKSNQYFTLVVPAGATNLKFVTSGGTGDADLYVKFNGTPTTTSNDCKSEGSTNAETCTIATAQAGTYTVLVHAYSAISGVSLTGSYSTGSGGGAQTYSNGSDVTIGDNTTVESPIAVSGRSGNGPSNASVAVNIVHTFRGDLKVELVAPDGTAYLLKTFNANDDADNVIANYTVNLSSEALNGTWKLRVNDNAVNDTGYINSWSVTF